MTTLIHNIGAILSGDLANLQIEAEAIQIDDAHITKIGALSEMDASPDSADIVSIDARGTTVAPGLIDSHVHIVFGDWTPRQNTLGWIESYMQGGITSMMSACEVHLPGRPKDAAGLKALAVAANRAYRDYRPGGVRVHAGSIILEPTLTEADIEAVNRDGVWLAKMGFGSFAKNVDAVPLVLKARSLGMVVMSHSGGVSIPGSNAITADDLLALDVDIAGHVNGGTTALPEADLERLVREGACCFQISQAGNIRSAVKVIEFAQQYGKLEKVIMSSDTPTGTGVMPLGTLKSTVEMTTLTDLSPAQTWAMATGSNARVLRKNTGRIAVGCEADLVLIDAPAGSAFTSAVEAMKGGDLPGISCVMIDGQIRTRRSRNTPLATRLCEVTGA